MELADISISALEQNPNLIREMREVLRQAEQAIHFTREYLGVERLPAIPGWSWYDATLRLKAILAALEVKED